MNDQATDREAANREAFARLCAAEPVLVDVIPAIDALPGMTRHAVLTSGAPLSWEDYYGGQRDALIGGALFEGLAADAADAAAKFASGEIVVGACSDYDCVGSLAGIYTASMPVFVVENQAHGTIGYCNMYEGKSPKRLNYGVYDDEVRQRLLYINDMVGPLIAKAVRASGGIPLKPIMKHALHMGDELHSRNTASSLLFAQALFPHIMELPSRWRQDAKKVVELLTEDHYFFLRLSMAAAAATARAAWDVEGSSVVTAMLFSCKEFAIRVSGLGAEWFRGPHAKVNAKVNAKLFDGHTEDEIAWMGGESPIVETIGGRLRPGRGLPAAGLPGRHGHDGAEPRALRHHHGRAHGLSHPGPAIPRHADRHRRLQGGGDGHPADAGHRHRRLGRRPDRRRQRVGAHGMLREGQGGVGGQVWRLTLTNRWAAASATLWAREAVNSYYRYWSSIATN